MGRTSSSPHFCAYLSFFRCSAYHIRLAPSQVPFVPFHLFGEKVTHSTAPSLPTKISFLREPYKKKIPSCTLLESLSVCRNKFFDKLKSLAHKSKAFSNFSLEASRFVNRFFQNFQSILGVDNIIFIYIGSNFLIIGGFHLIYCYF